MSCSHFEKENAAYSNAVPHSIPGLFSFPTAAAILRIARAMGELDASVVDLSTTNGTTGISESCANNIATAKDQGLTDFFAQLDRIERALMTSPPNNSTRLPTAYIVTVEGLDGSGKSSLVQGLVDALNNRNTDVRAVSMSTPTASMAAVRPVFDKRGGPVARAYYMVSNYLLQDDINKQLLLLDDKQEQEEQLKTTWVFVVDRWYTSTVAYSIAWKNTRGGTDAIDALNAALVQWPGDLKAPDLLFLLQVDSVIRRTRVQHRNGNTSNNNNNNINHDDNQQQHPTNFNPWDERLNQDEQLGCRVMRSFERVAQEGLSTRKTQTARLDANQSQAKVLEDAFQTVKEQLLLSKQQQQCNPRLEVFQTKPLQCFTWVSSELQLCHTQTGRRLKHAPWTMQVAWHGGKHGDCQQAPRLKTVGIHSTTVAGILFFMRVKIGDTTTTSASTTTTHASMVWCGGDYPFGQQWRAEGFLLPVSLSECEFVDTYPPPSLVAYAVACDQMERNNDASSTKDVYETARTLRKDPPGRSQQDQALQGMRFIPLRMEVLMGGPSSPGGPQRFEWTRSITDGPDGWSKARAILPFRGPRLPLQPILRNHLRPMTVAITGAHCAGKATLGKLVAQILGWSFQAELGEILRNQPTLAVAGHRVGDGSGKANAKTWDDQVWEAEVARDVSLEGHRVVETWHVGNLAWAILRVENNTETTADKKRSLVELHIERAKSAIGQEICDRGRCVLVIHLSIRPEDSVRRRHSNPSNAERIPMAMELAECEEMHHYLDVRAQEYLNTLQSELSFSSLILDNAQDDVESMKAAGQKIVEFINEQQWRRAFN